MNALSTNLADPVANSLLTLVPAPGQVLRSLVQLPFLLVFYRIVFKVRFSICRNSRRLGLGRFRILKIRRFGRFGGLQGAILAPGRALPCSLVSVIFRKLNYLWIRIRYQPRLSMGMVPPPVGPWLGWYDTGVRWQSRRHPTTTGGNHRYGRLCSKTQAKHARNDHRTCRSFPILHGLNLDHVTQGDTS